MRDFALGFIRDPRTRDGSSTRLAALLSVLAGCVAAVWGVATHYEASPIVAACLGGGAVTFFARTRSESDTPGEQP